MGLHSQEVQDKAVAAKPRRRARLAGIAGRYRVAVLAGTGAFLVVLVVITRFWSATGP